MADWGTAVGYAGAALVSVSTYGSVPAGDIMACVEAYFGRKGPASLKKLAETVERGLVAEIEVEHGGGAAVEPLRATLEDLLEHHAPNLRVVFELHEMQEERIAEAILTDGEGFLVDIDDAGRKLLRRLIEGIYARYLVQKGLLHEVVPVALDALFAAQIVSRQELERLWQEVESLTQRLEQRPPPRTIPPSVGDFQGYEEEIEQLKAVLTGGGAAAISAIHGIGGAGKTHLAYKVAALTAGNFPDGQLLVDMRGTTQPRSAADAMTDVLLALGAEEVRPETRHGEYHRYLKGKRLLLLLDNVASGAGLAELVPEPPAALLITSRARLALPGVTPIEIRHLSRPAAKALLRELAPVLDDAACDAIAELCCDLPLALRAAGSYLRETGYPPGDYIHELSKRRLARLTESAGDIERVDLDLFVVLGYSLDRLTEHDPALARMFTLLSVFPADFDVAGAAAVMDIEETEARRQLARLYRFGLVQRPTDGRYRLHDLLRDLANAKVDTPARAEAAAVYCNYYLTLLAWCGYEFNDRRIEVRRAMEIFERELPNFIAGIEHTRVAGDRPTAAGALLHMGILTTALGRHEDSLAATEEAVALYRQLAQELPAVFLPDLSASLNNLGNKLSILGRREEALKATTEAVDIDRYLVKHWSDDHLPGLAKSLNNRGIRLGDLGRHEEAVVATEEATDVFRRLAKKHPDIFMHLFAENLTNLSRMFKNINKHKKAMNVIKKAVRLYRCLVKKNPDAFRPGLARSLNNRGNILGDLGRSKEALEFTDEAIDLYRGLVVQRSEVLLLRDFARALIARANHLEALKRPHEALESNREAIEALSPTFLRYPKAVVEWMGAMNADYVQRCETLGVEPDMALLEPIAEVLATLHGGDQTDGA